MPFLIEVISKANHTPLIVELIKTGKTGGKQTKAGSQGIHRDLVLPSDRLLSNSLNTVTPHPFIDSPVLPHMHHLGSGIFQSAPYVLDKMHVKSTSANQRIYGMVQRPDVEKTTRDKSETRVLWMWKERSQHSGMSSSAERVLLSHHTNLKLGIRCCTNMACMKNTLISLNPYEKALMQEYGKSTKPPLHQMVPCWTYTCYSKMI